MNERLSVTEAAKRLGISEGALRQRINRGTMEYEKDEHGRVYVFIHGTHDEQYDDLSPVVEILRDQVEYLRRQLDEEREANRENRRLLAAALERIPELPAPASREARQDTVEASAEGEDTPTTPGGPEEPTERRSRSWWRRFFGFE
jgi:nitrogen fixation-related uncharacterized protein